MVGNLLGVVLLVIVAVLLAWDLGILKKKKKKRFRTIRLEPGQKVCLLTGRNRQCLGSDRHGFLVWFFPCGPISGEDLTFNYLIRLVRERKG